MKHQALFSSVGKSKKSKCCLLQFLFGALRINPKTLKYNISSIPPASSSTAPFPGPGDKQFGSMDGLNSLDPPAPTTKLSLRHCMSTNAIAALSFNNVYSNIWKVLLHQAMDPHPEVAAMARNLVNTVKLKVSCTISFCSALTKESFGA